MPRRQRGMGELDLAGLLAFLEALPDDNAVWSRRHREGRTVAEQVDREQPAAPLLM